MNKTDLECHILMWCDIMAVSVPLWAFGLAKWNTAAIWTAAAIFAVGFIGLCFGMTRYQMEKPALYPRLSRCVSLAARYVWPCILGALICIEYRFEPYPFYLLTAVAVGAIVITDCCKL